MLEVVLRLLAVTFAGLMMVAFGLYFTIGTDTMQHDYVFLLAGVIVLLGGLGALGGVVQIAMQVKEYGFDGLDSDARESNTIDTPAPARGGAAAKADVEEEASSESE